MKSEDMGSDHVYVLRVLILRVCVLSVWILSKGMGSELVDLDCMGSKSVGSEHEQLYPSLQRSISCACWW